MNKQKLLLSSLLVLSTTHVFAATIPAEAFSRGNCKFALPDLGYGWYNESISYDGFNGLHKNMQVKTEQKATNGNQRTKSDSNPSGYRVRAGYVDDINDTRFWTVSGTHYETLDSGRTVSQYSYASDCNGKLSQFI